MSSVSRFEIFLYQYIDRRHDRSWSWGGSNDDGSYGSEQILATTLFRLYLSMGGGDSNIARRQFASDYILFLLFKVTWRLGPKSNGAIAVEDFVDDMIDLDTYPSELSTPLPDLTDGCAKKVIRWSFEKQGLFGGDPPEVDVYIDDGRHGEYEYRSDPKSPYIYNLLQPDGALMHAIPQPSVKNYVYVKIKNRGTQKSSALFVKGWMSPTGIGLSWPDDFKPLITEELTHNAGIMPNQEVIVGPFEWIPESSDDRVLISVSCLEDHSIIDKWAFMPSCPLWRLTPFDNNLAIWGPIAIIDVCIIKKIIAYILGRLRWIINYLKIKIFHRPPPPPPPSRL